MEIKYIDLVCNVFCRARKTDAWYITTWVLSQDKGGVWMHFVLARRNYLVMRIYKLDTHCLFLWSKKIRNREGSVTSKHLWVSEAGCQARSCIYYCMKRRLNLYKCDELGIWRYVKSLSSLELKTLEIQVVDRSQMRILVRVVCFVWISTQQTQLIYSPIN